MKKAFQALAAGVFLASAGAASATPSTTFWTPATTYVQPFLVPHITYDTYFGDRAYFPIDTGLTMGILPFEKVQAEVGFDLFFPYVNYYFSQPASSLMLNAKLGLTEGAFGEWFPGISAGIYGAGFKYGTEYDIWHGEIGKTTPIGTFTVGGYYGAGPGPLWTGSDGVQRTGFMGAYLTPDVPINLTGLNKINFFGDVQTGKNAYGAWGVGVGLFFTPAIDILTGPIFFLDKTVQPGQQSVMWTIQLDVDIDFSAPKKEEKRT
jgi:hypothetical protein